MFQFFEIIEFFGKLSAARLTLLNVVLLVLHLLGWFEGVIPVIPSTPISPSSDHKSSLENLIEQKVMTFNTCQIKVPKAGFYLHFHDHKLQKGGFN